MILMSTFRRDIIANWSTQTQTKLKLDEYEQEIMRIEDTSKEFEPLLPTQDIILNHHQYGI